MNILLLGDITGRSRVALRMLSSVLEEKGHEVLMLPTALISNTLNLGRHEALDTTQYLLRSLAVWEELGIRCDIAYVGYITGEEQARALCPIMDDLRAKGVYVIVDPILGDNGHRYNSISGGQEAGMRLLCAHADLITPNLTEAALLCGRPYEALAAGNGLAQAIDALADKRSVLITSARTALGQDVIAGWDERERTPVTIPFERVPGHRWGTGDLFTGLLMDGLCAGMTLESAARAAGEGVARQLRGEEKSMLPE